MLKSLRGLCVGGLILSQAACSLHPLPEDFGPLPTFMIVRKIRCEAREAVKRELLFYLSTKKDDRVAQELVRELSPPSADIIKVMRPRIDHLSDDVKNDLTDFGDSGIAYDFAFDMTEANNIDPSLDLLKVFSNGMFSLGVSAKNDRKRQNIRNFTVTDTFVGLLRVNYDDYCEGELAAGKNYMYPITGKIGIAEMIRTFIALAIFGELNGEKGKEGRGPPTMVDSLKFTTHWALSVSPQLTITPGTSQALKFKNGLFAVSNERIDVHTVTVGLAINPGKTKLEEFFIGTFVTATGRPAERLAGSAVEQHIKRFETGDRLLLNGNGF